MEPLVPEWFYDEEHDAVVASTTTTTRIYVYLGHFRGVDTSTALAILATSPAAYVAPSASPMHP